MPLPKEKTMNRTVRYQRNVQEKVSEDLVMEEPTLVPPRDVILKESTDGLLEVVVGTGDFNANVEVVGTVLTPSDTVGKMVSKTPDDEDNS